MAFCSLELRVQFFLLVCCTYPSLSTVNKEKNRTDQSASFTSGHERNTTDTGPASPSTDSKKPGSWQGSRWSTSSSATGVTRPGKSPTRKAAFEHRCRYHWGQRASSDDSFHSPTVCPPSALDKLSIMKRYNRRRTCSHTSPRRSPTMVTFHDTRFVECRGWMTVGLWKLSSLDGRRPPWYRPQVCRSRGGRLTTRPPRG